MITPAEFRKALSWMREIAREAVDIADRCHGGHSYESLGSRDEGKCCEARRQVDDLKERLQKLTLEMDKRELPKRKAR